MKKIWRNIYHFFPIQLLFLHVRRSFLLLTFWVVLFGLAGGWFFQSIGIPYLFEMPEYLGEVSFVSYFIMGIVLGFFVMAFHIASYIFYSYRFTFLATLSRPLYRFSINNSVIPIAFFLFYGFTVAGALQEQGFSVGQIMMNELGLMTGSIFSIMLAYTYFFTTLKGPKGESKHQSILPKPLAMIIYKDKKLEESPEDKNVFTYLRNFRTIRIARKSGHYEVEERLKTLQQHHQHAAIYFLLLISFVILWGLFSGNRLFMIPAGASIVLMLTTYLMIFGALFSWLKTWTMSLILVGAFVLNYISGFPEFQRIHKVGGLDYISEPLSFSYQSLEAITTDAIIEKDKKDMIAVLEAWKKNQTSAKPKLVIFNSSGGGLRSSLFSLAILQHLDSLSGGEFTKSMFLITGSSGGMIGSAYYRELKWQEKQGVITSANQPKYYNILGTDVLNDVGFTLAVNDLFIPFKKYKKGGFQYSYDRGTAWDYRFNENTNYLLEKPFGAYKTLEQTGQVPLMILSPTVINRGQRLLISPLGLSFLSRHQPDYQSRVTDLYDGVEFSRFFKSRQGDSLSFVTALRLSSTFPYITPMVSLPTKPRMEVIDAGARDNDGILLTIRFLHNFKDWIAENTSGVVVVQALAAQPVLVDIEPDPYKTRFQSLVKPLGAMVQSFGTLQGYTRAEILSYASEWMHNDFEIVQLDLLQNKADVSLSWHLTQREKEFILNTVYSDRLKPKFEDLAQKKAN